MEKLSRSKMTATRSSDILSASRGALTNDQLIVQFLEACRIAGRSENTIEAYCDDLCDFRDFLGFLHVAAVTRDDLRSYMDYLITEEYKDSSVRRKQTCLKMFYRLMLADGIIGNDPSVVLEAPKKARRLPDHLQHDEINKILPLVAPPDMNPRDRAMLELMYGAGLRVSELLRLTLRDVHFDTRSILVMGKGQKQRYVPLGGRAAEALRCYLATRSDIEPTTRLFDFTRQWVWQIVSSYSEAIGRHIHPHTLRHTFATHMQQNGANMRAIQIMLGHADIGTTEIYAHVDPKWVRQSYMDCHPRATGKHRQIKLEFDAPREFVFRRICQECAQRAAPGRTKCEKHLRLNAISSRLCIARKTRNQREEKTKCKELSKEPQLSGLPQDIVTNATKERSDNGLTASRFALSTGSHRAGTASIVEAGK